MKLHAARLILLALAVLSACPLAGGRVGLPEPVITGFVTRSIDMNGQPFRYQVFIPADYDAARAWPAILFLHGAGERGSDNEAQVNVGLGPVVRSRADDFPAIVVFPQVPADSIWAGSVADAALRALDATARELNVDRERIYLTGLSMGGFGTWELASRQPERFAALVPICGGVTPPRPGAFISVRAVPASAPDPDRWVAERVRGAPAWLFHGAEDQLVPAELSRRMHAALRDAGGSVRYTEYPGVGHNSWDQAYAEPELWRWLFAQRRD